MESHSRNRRRAGGFSLIELLVVIAIIAILAGFLFPVFSQLRAKARTTTCQSNFKQIATATLLYVQDYDDRFPLAAYSDICRLPDATFHTLIQPYLRSERVLVCPGDFNDGPDRANSPCFGTPPANEEERSLWFTVRSNFGYNAQYFSPGVWNPVRKAYEGRSVSDSEVDRQAETLLGLDSVWWADQDGYGRPIEGGTWIVDPPCRWYQDGTDSFRAVPPGAQSFWWGGWTPSDPRFIGRYGYVWPWHNKRVNVAFVDGHVKTLTIDALTAGCEVKDGWGGRIFDSKKYLWDLD